MSDVESLILAHAVGLAVLLGYAAWLIRALGKSERRR